MTDNRPARRDCRDILRDAADLALLGIVVTVAAVPVVTAAAAVATASAAVHDWITDGTWPSARRSLARLGGALLPGLPVTLVAAATAALLSLNVAVLAGGTVPGGTPALLVTLAVAALIAGYAGLVVVQVGRTGGRQWRTAASAVVRHCRARPVTWLSASGVTLLVGLLAVLVTPIVLPILVGYVFAALHAVARHRALSPLERM